MQITFTPTLSVCKTFNAKECVNRMELIAFKDESFHQLAKIKWYMGRSKNSSVVYCKTWLSGQLIPSEVKIFGVLGIGESEASGFKENSSFSNAFKNAGFTTDFDFTAYSFRGIEHFLHELANQSGFDKTYISKG